MSVGWALVFPSFGAPSGPGATSLELPELVHLAPLVLVDRSLERELSVSEDGSARETALLVVVEGVRVRWDEDPVSAHCSLVPLEPVVPDLFPDDLSDSLFGKRLLSISNS